MLFLVLSLLSSLIFVHQRNETKQMAPLPGGGRGVGGDGWGESVGGEGWGRERGVELWGKGVGGRVDVPKCWYPCMKFITRLVQLIFCYLERPHSSINNIPEKSFKWERIMAEFKKIFYPNSGQPFIVLYVL